MNNPFCLQAIRLKQDSRILKGIKLIMEGVRSQEYFLTDVRPPQSEFMQSYRETLETFQTLRGGNLYFPFLGSGWGHGPFVELLDGSVKYDMISGIGPHFWGHSYPELIEIALEAALSDTIMQGHLQQNRDALSISHLLVQVSGLDHCFLSSSGAMANENALKLVLQKKSPANRILAFERCFMGRTLALSQISDKPTFREGLPTTLAVDYVPFYQSIDPIGSTKKAVNSLQKYIARYPERHATMCFELVQGEGGFHAGTTDFFLAIMKVLKEHNIPIFIDEIQTFGRTPQLFAYQYFQLQDYVDVVSIGKLSQVCATLFRTKLKPQAGLLSQTFTSSTVSLQTSYWIVNRLLSGNFYGDMGKLNILHKRFEGHFRRLEARWPTRLQGPYGIGGMVIFTPFDGDAQRVARFVQDLFHAGIISFVAGSDPTRVRFLIPGGILTLEQVDAVMVIVEEVLGNSDETN